MSANLADIMVAISLSDRLSKPVSGICGNLSAMVQRFKEVTESAETFGNKMTALSRDMNRYGKNMMGEAISGAMGLQLITDRLMSPIMESATFEQAIGRVKALVEDGTGEIHKMLDEQARQLGRDTQFTNLQAAQTMETLARANFDGDAINAAMPHLLNMAAVEGMDLNEASSIMAGALRGFGIDAADTQRVVDVLAMGSAIAKTNIQGLGESMKYAAPAARTMGVSIEEATAMIGVMADNSIDASMAGTALSMGLSQLASKQDKLAGYNIRIADSKGDMLPILDVLKQIEAVTDKMGNMQKQDFLTDVFGERAGRGMSVVLRGIKEGADGMSEFTKKLAQLKGASDAFDGMGFAAAKATAVNDTLFGTLTRLSSAWSDLKTNIGDAFKEDFRKFIETITQLVTTISKFVTENPKLVAAIQKVVVSLLALKAATLTFGFALGGMISSVGTLIGYGGKIGTFAKTFGALRKTGETVGKALAGAGSEAGGFFRIFKLLTSPVFWLIAGLAALAVAIYLVYTHWDDLGTYVKEHKALFATLATLIGVGLVAAFYGAASAAWSFTIALLANPITWIILLIAALVGAILYLYYNWDDVCYEWRVSWEQFKHVCELAIDEIVAYFQPLINSFYAVKDAMSALFSGDFKGAFDAIAADKYIMQTGQTVRDNWNSRFGGASEGAASANIGGHKFATGGFFDRPTLGIFGEAGPEWIIPADGSQRTLGLLADAAAANGISLGGGVGVAGGGVTISGPVYISVPETDNAEAFVEKLAQGLRRYASSQGAVAY